jgi:hypothetical protein
MSRVVSPKRWTAFFDEHGKTRECKISFSVKLQSAIEIPSPESESSASPISADRFFCSEQIAEETIDSRHPGVKMHTFKRKITYTPSDNQQPTICTVRFSLKSPSAIERPKAAERRSGALYPAAFKKFGGFNLHAPKSFGSRTGH